MAENYRHPISVWGSLARGAVGGFFGVFIFFGYAVYKNPYGIMNLGSFLPFVWIAIVTGLVVGATVWLCGRFRGKSLGVLLRVAVSVVVSFIVAAPYLYLREHPDNVERWWKYSVVFGLGVGSIAGLLSYTTNRSKTDVKAASV